MLAAHAAPSIPRVGVGAVVSPSSSNNSLGRAMVIAEVAAQFCGRVELLAIDDGPVWGPAASAANLRVGDRAAILGRLDELAGTDPDLVVAVVKPDAASAGLVRSWLDRGRVRPRLWFDEDDHDEAIARFWTEQASPRRRITSQLTNANAAWRVRRRVRWWASHADVVTTSSQALGRALALPGPTTALLPHVRLPLPFAPPSPSPVLRFGFLGTPVKYKGLDELVQLLAWFPEAELHVFEQTVDAFVAAGAARDRIRTHDGRAADAVGRALGSVDIVVLPQDASEPAARYQLPAKLLDALQSGRPAVVSATPVTSDYRRDGIAVISDWSDEAAVRAAVESMGDAEARATLGRALADWCARELSTATGAARVQDVLFAGGDRR